MNKFADKYVVSETDALKIKCAHLEFQLLRDRVQKQLDDIVKVRDDAMRAALAGCNENASIEQYSYDMATGVFARVEETNTEETSA